MTDFLAEYGLFLAKTVTLVVAVLVILLAVAANAARHRTEGKSKGHIVVRKINRELDDLKDDIRHEVLEHDVLKDEEKAEKKRKKAEAKQKEKERKARSKAAAGEASDDKAGKRVYVLDFEGDLKASQVSELRKTITAVLTLARPGKDEVVLRLESPGGMVHGYGLAASQLTRLRSHDIPLTICVDKVAASGGYMMACVGNRVLAAPFAYIGSIGVVVQLPNLHRLLKEHNVDYEMVTAGEYKRTLTVFGENTEKGRAKMQEDVDEMHELFKGFIHEYRPSLDIAPVATGEVWTGKQALERGLIDQIDTSDELIGRLCREADVFEVSWEEKKPFKDKLSSLLEGSLTAAFDKSLMRWLHRADKEKYYS